MQVPGASFRAGGQIGVGLFVTPDTSNDFQVVQATANSIIYGVAQEGQRYAPGLTGSDNTIAAYTGDQVEVVGIGNVALVQAGGTVTRGDPLEANSSGQAITSAISGQRWIGGFALESGASGAFIRMWVMPMQVTH